MSKGGRQPSGLFSSFQEHYADLLRFLVRRMGNAEQAADVAQDTYLRLVVTGDTPSDIRDPRAYLFRVAGNLAIDVLRRDARRAAVTGTDEEAESIPDPAPAPEGALLARERIRLLDSALRELPPNARQALLLSRMDSLTHAQIAARLGVSESMVAKYIAQALRHCRDRLESVHGKE